MASLLSAGRYAAIDIGTVTCRMLVADVSIAPEDALQPVSLHEVAKEYAVVNLGEGVDATHRLNPQAIARTIDAIDTFLEIRDAFDVPEHPLVGTAVMATSASRDADNAEEFAELLHERGLSLLIIPGEREAALSFEGATMEYVGRNVAVVDVGGGSTEISIGMGGQTPFASRSFNIGCRRMTERFLNQYPPSRENIEKARLWVRNEFAAWLEKLDEIEGIGEPCEPYEPCEPALPSERTERSGCADGDTTTRPAPLSLIAVAGTATSAVSMREEMAVYDSKRVHGATVTTADMQKLFDRLSQMSLLQLENIIGLDPKRAPVILAGMIILQEAMRALQTDSFIASESDILQGMIMYQATSQVV